MCAVLSRSIHSFHTCRKQTWCQMYLFLQLCVYKCQGKMCLVRLQLIVIHKVSCTKIVKSRDRKQIKRINKFFQDLKQQQREFVVLSFYGYFALRFLICFSLVLAFGTLRRFMLMPMLPPSLFSLLEIVIAIMVVDCIQSSSL